MALCPDVPEVYYSEWGNAMQARLKGRRYPLGGMFELTERCNNNCVHCYINQTANSQAAKAREVTTGQAKQILTQIAEAGCLYLTLSGGEVLLRPDFPEIYHHAKRCGLLVGIFTNATLVTPELADMFVEDKPRWLDITLYGATRETYERVTRVPGSYDRCMRGIELLKERSLPVYLKAVALTLNSAELPVMKAFAESFTDSFRFDGVIWPRLDGSMEPLKYRLSPEELIDLEDVDANRLAEWKRMADSFSGSLTRKEAVYSCGAALQSFNVSSAGELMGCNMSRKPAYPILEYGFQNAWERLGEIRTLKRQKSVKCQACEFGGMCSQCPGWSQVFFGDNETPVEFNCQLAHLHMTQVEDIISL